MVVDIRYFVRFGRLDSSNWINWEIILNDEEAEAYNNAVANKIPLNDVPKLEDALYRAYKEIEEVEIEYGIDNGDEYVRECQGEIPMDADELNDLVAARDAHALEFFGLTGADEDEIDAWDAYDLDELPYINEFVENFEPYSPFSEGWDLIVEYVDPNKE